MKISGQQLIKAKRDKVFSSLIDPAMLSQAIPGCEKLDKTSENEMAATVVLRIGPIKASFQGNVQLSDINPPESFMLSGQGKGGAAGHASGDAKVKLVEHAEGTMLEYEVESKVGGKIAQLGGRLIESTAKKLIAQFFAKFNDVIVGPSEDASSHMPAEKTNKTSQIIWITTIVIVLGAMLAYLI